MVPSNCFNAALKVCKLKANALTVLLVNPSLHQKILIALSAYTLNEATELLLAFKQAADSESLRAKSVDTYDPTNMNLATL